MSSNNIFVSLVIFSLGLGYIEAICDEIGMTAIGSCMSTHIPGYSKFAQDNPTGAPEGYETNWKFLVDTMIPLACSVMDNFAATEQCWKDSAPDCLTGEIGESLYSQLNVLRGNYTELCRNDCYLEFFPCLKNYSQVIQPQLVGQSDETVCSSMENIWLPCIWRSQPICPDYYSFYERLMVDEMSTVLAKSCPDISLDHEPYTMPPIVNSTVTSSVRRMVTTDSTTAIDETGGSDIATAHLMMTVLCLTLVFSLRR
ncbi:unnamed protein product [Owenia fusiformis]|uniref:Folate receptor-like domain-containing protein n=1 Tax=Owenia fusiformis TaxID=6347 RepID=A0A8S4PXC2_OWEFU|nr:unnamed protein product [Owenia fusiformis]